MSNSNEEMRQYIREGAGGNQFDTLTNLHPVRRRSEKPVSCSLDKNDPRNDVDYDTFFYGTEPLPGDLAWTRHARRVANMSPVPPYPTWKDNGRPIQ